MENAEGYGIINLRSPVRSLGNVIDVASLVMNTVRLLLFSTTTKTICRFVYVTVSSLINIDRVSFWRCDCLCRFSSYWYVLLILRNLEFHLSKLLTLRHHIWLYIWAVYCEYVLYSSLQWLFPLISKWVRGLLVHTHRHWDPGILLVERCINEDICVERSDFQSNMRNNIFFGLCGSDSINGVRWRCSFSVLLTLFFKALDFTMIKELGILVLEGQTVRTVDIRLEMFLLLWNQKMMFGYCVYPYQHGIIYMTWLKTTTKHVISYSGSVWTGLRCNRWIESKDLIVGKRCLTIIDGSQYQDHFRPSTKLDKVSVSRPCLQLCKLASCYYFF